jgi:monoamine oxidase
MRIGIIGGSYGGLSAALALRCVGHDVRIFERTTAFDRIGGGIVVQPDFAEYLESFGYARPEAVAVSTTRRRFLARDGSVKHTTSDSVFYTAWDVLLRSMRAAFDAERNWLSGPYRGTILKRFSGKANLPTGLDGCSQAAFLLCSWLLSRSGVIMPQLASALRLRFTRSFHWRHY